MSRLQRENDRGTYKFNGQEKISAAVQRIWCNIHNKQLDLDMIPLI